MARAKFKFAEFSPKQKRLLYWWNKDSPMRDKDIVIADGAVRSGKTIACVCGFLTWSLSCFSGETFILAGRSSGALKRNVISPLLKILDTWGIPYHYQRSGSDPHIAIGSNIYYLFGANNEAAQDVIQGMTAAGAYADEAALFPLSFLRQMTARCSVTGAKIWMNCNPAGGKKHKFYQEYLTESMVSEKNIYYMHFTMDDNYSLAESTKQRYKRAFHGVFYNRNVLGQWVVADGLIYGQFANNKRNYVLNREQIPRRFDKVLIGVDFGDSGSAHSFVAVGITHNYGDLIGLLSEKHDAKKLTPLDVENKVCNFVEKVIKRYGRVDMINCDHLNTLINGIRVRLRDRGLNVSIVRTAKPEIIERITTTVVLLGLDKFRLTKGCQTLADALETAVWDPDNPDRRLDDGTSDIDTLDAFEYAWATYLEMFAVGRYDMTV